jgi:hypothetical protein
LLTGEGVPFLTVITHRDLLKRIATGRRIDTAFDESPAFKAVEDWDLTLRLAQLAEPVYIREPLAQYRAHSGGISKTWDKNFERTTTLIRKYRRAGANRMLCRRAYRLQLSKRAAQRMLHNAGPWRADLLNACIPPQTARDAVLAALPLLPRPLARKVYEAALVRKRRG